MRRRLFLFLLLLPTLAGPAWGSTLFGKKPSKPTPAERVPELVNIIKTDGDENKRTAAAEELRQYDPVAFPEIVPALIEVLLNDKKAAVRSEAASTLGKLRPVSPTVGAALEQARDKDASMRVRLQARSSLLQYHWHGYHAPTKDDPPAKAKESKEPPLATTTVAKPVTAAVAPPKLTAVPATPPMAPVPVAPAPVTVPTVPAPPDGPALPPPDGL